MRFVKQPVFPMSEACESTCSPKYGKPIRGGPERCGFKLTANKLWHLLVATPLSGFDLSCHSNAVRPVSHGKPFG